jgi:chromosome segregation ATPase
MTDRKLLEKLDEKMDKVEEKLGSIDVTLAKNTSSLDEHIRRTELAEEAISIIKNEMAPIQKHVTQVHTIFQAIGFVSVVVSIAAGVVKVAEFLF